MGHLKVLLAEALAAQKQFAKAKSWAVKGYQQLVRNRFSPSAETGNEHLDALRQLIAICDSLGAAEEVKKWQVELAQSSARSTPRYALRTWKDKAGEFVILAQLISRNRKRVRIKPQSGRVLALDVGNLSDEDQRYLLTLGQDTN